MFLADLCSFKECIFTSSNTRLLKVLAILARLSSAGSRSYEHVQQRVERVKESSQLRAGSTHPVPSPPSSRLTPHRSRSAHSASVDWLGCLTVTALNCTSSSDRRSSQLGASSPSSPERAHLGWRLTVSHTRTHADMARAGAVQELPVEVIFAIFGELYGRDDLDGLCRLSSMRRDLASASLTCRSWSGPAQALLYREIALDSRRLPFFLQMKERRRFAFTVSLSIVADPHASTAALDLESTLLALPNLTSLVVPSAVASPIFLLNLP